MKLVRIIAGSCVVVASLAAPCPISAEEIILKDGQKIVGTIIGYEKDMFRVETDYGIALVRKDKVASIQMSKPDAATTANPQAPSRAATKTLEVKPTHIAAAPEATPAPVAPPPMLPTAPIFHPVYVHVPALTAEPLPPPVIRLVDPARTAQGVLPPGLGPGSIITNGLPPPPPPASHPVDVPMPEHLQEHISGNTYFSDTFQFSMFKPPDWKIYEGVPKETGSGIMAMGTEDEQTLLIVDRQVWSGTPKLTSDQVEAKLRQTYQEYHRISEEPFGCDGQKAIRRNFTGVVDGAEWHGVAVHVIHGNMVLGIIGLTSSETFQFQEAIFNKIIKSFQFLAAPASSAGLPSP